MNNNNLLQLQQDINQFWEYVNELNGDMYCNCGAKFWKDQTTKRRRILRCSKSGRSFSLIYFLKNHIVNDRENEIIFSEIRPNFEEFYAPILNPEPCTSSRKRLHHDSIIPPSLRRKIEEHRGQLENNKQDISTSEEEMEQSEDDEELELTPEEIKINEMIKQECPDGDFTDEEINKKKYNYKFNGKKPINKNEYCKMWMYGMQFENTKEFIKFIESKSRYRHMIKTAFLIGQHVVEVHVKKIDLKNFLLDMDKVAEFEFVTTKMDRISKRIGEEIKVFKCLEKDEYDSAYPNFGNKYFHNYLLN